MRALPVVAQEALDLGGVGGQGSFVGRRERRERGEGDLAARHRPGGDGAATDQGERAEHATGYDQLAVLPQDGLARGPAQQDRVKGAKQPRRRQRWIVMPGLGGAAALG